MGVVGSRGRIRTQPTGTRPHGSGATSALVLQPCENPLRDRALRFEGGGACPLLCRTAKYVVSERSRRHLGGRPHRVFSGRVRDALTAEGPMTTRAQRVLVVDDDTEIRGLVAGTLRRDGYTVVEAGDGPEALDV